MWAMDAILGAGIRGLVVEFWVWFCFQSERSRSGMGLMYYYGWPLVTGMACTIWMWMWMGMILSDGAWMAALIISAMVDC